jgi:hypothetical protein
MNNSESWEEAYESRLEHLALDSASETAATEMRIPRITPRSVKPLGNLHPRMQAYSENKGELTARRLVIAFAPTTGLETGGLPSGGCGLKWRARVPIGQGLWPR